MGEHMENIPTLLSWGLLNETLLYSGLLIFLFQILT